MTPYVVSWRPVTRYVECHTSREAYDLLRDLAPSELLSALVRRDGKPDQTGTEHLLALKVLYDE